MRRIVSISIVLFAALLASPGLFPQTDLKPILDRLEETRGGTGYWETVARMEAVGREALPDVAEGLRRANPYVRIGCAKYLYTFGKKADAVAALIRIVQGDDTTSMALAANLLANLTRKNTGYGDPIALTQQLKKRLQEASDVAARIAIARALQSVSDGSDITPLRTLRATLKSSDPEIKALGALALAEMEEFNQDVVDVLERLAREPGDRGRLAAACLAVKRFGDVVDREAGSKIAGGGRYALLDEILDVLRHQYFTTEPLKERELIEAAAKGMASALDPYTAYLDEKEYQALMSGIDGKYGGIGARVAMKRDRVGNAWLTIERPIYSGPAYKAGLRSGDRIVEIEGEPAVNRDLTELVSRLKGEPGKVVTFKVHRRGWKAAKEEKLVRALITLETVISEVLPGNVGYLHLTTFGPQSAPQSEEALKDLEAKGIQALILDIRANSGGLLKAAVDMAGLFVPKDTLVVTVRSRDTEETHRTRMTPVCKVPLVILIDSGSASASEILAGVLRHYGRAICVGEQTFGKGSVQQLPELRSTPSKDALRLTIAKYYLPNGKSPQKEKDAKTWGIEPDVKADAVEPDYWLAEANEKIRQSGKLDDYVKEKLPQHKDLFRALATDDAGDPARYPDLDKLLASLDPPLNKKLEPDDLRQLVREQLRRWVADDQGKDFNLDYQADVVLQRGIIEALKKTGRDAKTIPAYTNFARKLDKEGAAHSAGSSTGPLLPK
jgi:carboxyl-terminal processing protease